MRKMQLYAADSQSNNINPSVFNFVIFVRGTIKLSVGHHNPTKCLRPGRAVGFVVLEPGQER